MKPAPSCSSHKSGFTVIELLVVIAITCILIALVLVGLNAAQRQARDQNRVTNIHTIAVGLQQYFNACGEYPTTLTGSASDIASGADSCQNQAVTITNFIPNIATYNFNQSGSDYHYESIATSPTFDPGASADDCIAFHLGVSLEGTAPSSAQKSGAPAFDPNKYVSCTNGVTQSSGDFDGTPANVFDLEYPMLK